MYDSGCSVDHSAEIAVGLFTAHGDGFEFLDFGEEVFDQVPPLVHDFVNLPWLKALWSLGNDYLRTAGIHFCDDPVRVEGLVGQ